MNQDCNSYLKGGVLENMEKVKIVRHFICTRCGWDWIPRDREQQDIESKEVPALCPNCNSAYWNKPKKIKNENLIKEQQTA